MWQQWYGLGYVYETAIKNVHVKNLLIEAVFTHEKWQKMQKKDDVSRQIKYDIDALLHSSQNASIAPLGKCLLPCVLALDASHGVQNHLICTFPNVALPRIRELCWGFERFVLVLRYFHSTQNEWKNKYCLCTPCSTGKRHYWQKLCLFWGLVSENTSTIKSLRREVNGETGQLERGQTAEVIRLNKPILLNTIRDMCEIRTWLILIWVNCPLNVILILDADSGCLHISKITCQSKSSGQSLYWTGSLLKIELLQLLSVFSHCNYHCSPQAPHSFSVYLKQAPNGKYITFWAAQATSSMTPTAINSKSNIFNELGEGWNTSVFHLWYERTKT